MEPLFKQIAVKDRRCEVYGSCSSSSQDDDEEEEVDDLESSSSPSPLQDMSSLLLQLPLKRGLSKHYSAKSESFTSLSDVKRVEDLAKKEKNPISKKLKLCNNPSSSSSRSHFSSLISGGGTSSGFLENNNNKNDDKPLLFPHPIDQRVA